MVTPGVEDSSLRYLQNFEERYEHIYKCVPIFVLFLLFNTRSTFDNTMLFQIGASIRLDTTLVDFTEMRWERGDITFLYRGDAASPEESLYVLDNQLRVYQKVYFLILMK